MKRCLSFLLALLLCGTAACACAEITVGPDITEGDITDFYYTVDASIYPPVYQRYRFYAEDGKKLFYHESRQGDSWPQTEKDITVSGTVELTEEAWSAFFDCLRGGAVKARGDEILDGDSGPWMYLYWTGDKGKLQEFSFASLEKRIEFEELCTRLAQNRVLTLFYFSRGGYMVPQSYEITLRNGTYFLRENEDKPRIIDPESVAGLQEIIASYGLESWNGFHESDPYVLDGEGFLLKLDYADGTTVYAAGDNAFPDNYFEAAARIEAIFEKEKMAHIAGAYRYEGEGFGGSFIITLNADGTYTFCEGWLSSYQGGGEWSVYSNAVYMREENGFDLDFTLGIEDGALIYLAMGSDAFPSVKVADGERFVRLETEENREP